VAAGRLVQFSDQAYSLFYFDDVKEDDSGASFDKDSQTFALILKEDDDMHVFLIPEDTVSSETIAIFKMHKNKKVGLRKADGKLEIYENP